MCRFYVDFLSTNFIEFILQIVEKLLKIHSVLHVVVNPRSVKKTTRSNSAWGNC